jgi:hypothetical protein
VTPAAPLPAGGSTPAAAPELPPLAPELPPLAPETSAALHDLQCLDDSITYRTARLAGPCPGCAPAARCPDHASDEQLITASRQRHAAVLAAFLDRYDPADVRAIVTGSDATPPVVLASAVALHARLRDLAADGPLITTLGGVPAVIELDGGQLTERRLAGHD